MTGRFLGALQFLTVFPVHRSTPSPGEAAVFFPVIGALLGAFTGGALLVFTAGVGRPLGSLLALALLLILTGCLHEDGLADVADAVRAGRTRERMLEILKDSRIGTYGAIALILSIGLRWQSLTQAANPVYGLAAALTLSRTSLIALAALAPPVGSGLGQAFAAALSGATPAATVTLAVVICALMGLVTPWQTIAAMMVSTAAVVLMSRWYFTRRLGGVNGDCLGATCQAVEMVNLVILACQPSI
jgi:adenosylcobinamide-GDP ribazoletransferase